VPPKYDKRIGLPSLVSIANGNGKLMCFTLLHDFPSLSWKIEASWPIDRYSWYIEFLAWFAMLILLICVFLLQQPVFGSISPLPDQENLQRFERMVSWTLKIRVLGTTDTMRFLFCSWCLRRWDRMEQNGVEWIRMCYNWVIAIICYDTCGIIYIFIYIYIDIIFILILYLYL